MPKWLSLAGVIVLLDQISKWYVVETFAYGQRKPVLPVFDLTLLYNKGAAFSFLAQGHGWQRGLLITIAVVACFFILWLMRRHPGQTRFLLALSLVLGGALGNLIDRIFLGHVVDFVLLHWRGWYYPAFNIADMAISVGAVLIFWDEWLRWRSHRRTAKSSESKQSITRD